MEIKSPAGIMGIRLEKRGPDDNHICIRLLGEDDGHWWDTDIYFSSSWLADYIKVLQKAETYCKSQKPDIQKGIQYGWEFKDND